MAMPERPRPARLLRPDCPGSRNRLAAAACSGRGQLAVPFVALVMLAAAVGAAATTHVPAHESRDAATAHVTALAVSETAEGLHGVAAQVEATVLGGGSGQVFVSTKPLAATDMQGSARLAARVASSLLGVDPAAYDHLVQFSAGSTVIGGPSAGAVMTLALTTALHNVDHPADLWRIDPRVAATGTINPDGTIGPVGGVPDKAEAAAAAGITLFLYPAGLDNATTYEPGPFGLRPVTVEMASHCASLEMTCRPAATVRDLLAAATGVQLAEPDVPTPSTADYIVQLEPGVRAEVEELERRIGALPDTPGAAAAPLQTARERLGSAKDALDGGLLYRSATQAFQGLIQAGWAENLTAFHAADRDQEVVRAALAGCRQRADAALTHVQGQDVSQLNGVYALAAAQQRAYAAGALAQEAQAQVDRAVRYSDLEQALLTASFCTERAATAHWWSALGTRFGSSPEVDVAALLEDHLERAREAAAYADAVRPGSAGVAHSHIQEATELLESGLLPGALWAAIQAEVQASVAVQTAASDEVPPRVLAAARNAAFQAIAQARSRGIEPVLAVSLLELADIQAEPGQALGDLWTARSLALLDAAPLGTPEVTRTAVALPGAYSQDSLMAFLAIGALVGGALVAVVFSVWRPRL